MPRWPAAKAAFPAWAATPRPTAPKLMRKLGELITRHVPEIARTETIDTGQAIGQTGNSWCRARPTTSSYFAEMCVRVDGHTYPRPRT